MRPHRRGLRLTAPAQPEWFDRPRRGEQAPGLRFACTMCGNCCTGPEGYVLVSDDETEALAGRLGVSTSEFLARYTRASAAGRSLTERPTEHGLDCVFLDRTTIPGKAVCGVYEDRPAQCRTWPFWRSNLTSEGAWRRAQSICPGMNSGPLTAPQRIRILRAEVDI